MRFGPIAVRHSAGAILAHAIRAPGVNLKKGEVIGLGHIAVLQAAGIEEIVGAVLEPDDIGEDEAAAFVARGLAGAGVGYDQPFTGRCNLTAKVAGLILVDRAVVDAVNAEDEAILVATAQPMQPVLAGEMVAAVKVVPFAVPSSLLHRALRQSTGPAISIAPFRPMRIGVVSTLLPGLKRSGIDRTMSLLESRLAPTGAIIAFDHRVMHEAGALATALRTIRDCDLLVIVGASAITDRRDVVPTGIVMAGGVVEHLGMPVDPGSMLLLGEIAIESRQRSIPVIGAPGCVRSASFGSFDLVLPRLLAGLEVKGGDLRGLGVGGLVGESAMASSRRRLETSTRIQFPVD